MIAQAIGQTLDVMRQVGGDDDALAHVYPTINEAVAASRAPAQTKSQTQWVLPLDR